MKSKNSVAVTRFCHPREFAHEPVIFVYCKRSVFGAGSACGLFFDVVHEFGHVDPFAEEIERPAAGVPCASRDFGLIERVGAIKVQVVVGDRLRMEGFVECGFVPFGKDADMAFSGGDAFAGKARFAVE